MGGLNDRKDPRGLADRGAARRVLYPLADTQKRHPINYRLKSARSRTGGAAATPCAPLRARVHLSAFPEPRMDPRAFVNISEIIDRSRLGAFQIGVFVLCGLCLIMDGFDVQAMGY